MEINAPCRTAMILPIQIDGTGVLLEVNAHRKGVSDGYVCFGTCDMSFQCGKVFTWHVNVGTMRTDCTFLRKCLDLVVFCGYYRKLERILYMIYQLTAPLMTLPVMPSIHKLMTRWCWTRFRISSYRVCKSAREY